MNNNWPSANDWLTSQRGERGLSPPCQPLNVLLEAGRKYQVIETNTLPFFYHFCMVNNLYLQHRHISKCHTKWWSLSLLAQYFYKRSRSRFRLKRCWSCISTFYFIGKIRDNHKVSFFCFVRNKRNRSVKRTERCKKGLFPVQRGEKRSVKAVDMVDTNQPSMVG